MRIQPWTKPQRDELLRSLRDERSERTYELPFQERLQTLYIHRVDICMPCYRLSNGRTRAAQREWTACHDERPDFFEDPDSRPALKAQDEILRDMARDAGLLDILRSSPQDQPLILDYGGYVVNGNRRLCVMRKLVEEAEGQYEHFRHVDVVLLPLCTDDDVRELEGRLQVRREGKADYSWVSLGLMCRDRRAANWSEQRIADLYDRRRGQIRELIQMLDDAEAYLADRGQEGRYSHVSDMEYAFRQLAKARGRCRADEAKKVVVTQLAYALMDTRQDAGDRLYSQIPELLDSLDSIAEDLRSELPAHDPDARSESGLSLLGGGVGSPYSDLIEPLRDPDNRATVVAVLRNTLEEARAAQRGRETAGYCAGRVRAALTALQEAISAWGEQTQADGVPEALAEIEQAVIAIRRRLGPP